MSGHVTSLRLRSLRYVVAAGVVALSLSACSGGSNSSTSSNSNTTTSAGSGGSTSSGGTGNGVEVKLGYFPNLTHASAIVGIKKGYFKSALASDGATLKALDFNSGSDTIDALLSGSLDATYIGPSPAISAYATSQNVSIISGATSGGASLVVSKNITSASDLAGKTLATPGQGNTQDVALKYWLKQKGYQVSPDGQGDLTVIPQDNSLTVQQFQQGKIDGAWVPEPYASILVGLGGKRLVDEASLWPQGKFVTTQLLVNNDFLKAHPDLVDALLKGQIQANDYIAKNSDAAKQLTGDYIAQLTGGKIEPKVLDSAWSKLTFTNDPNANTLLKSASHAVAVGLIQPINGLSKIYDLDPLNKLLAAKGEPQVSGAGTQ
ncbi:MAG: sulfonate transport system substrate-binding protein [Actinomycetota bacterium]|nr:sulfonate transport system substrate-binding protein [Actinomycetota bacterium]